MATTGVTSSFIDSSIITTDDFNKITDIHDQTQLDPNMLPAIAAIFQSQGVTNTFGFQLLHRHYQIPEASIALTAPIGSIIVTKITPVANVDTTAIRGQLYLLNDKGKFQAYEYEYGPPISVPMEFLTELASFIQKNGLQTKFALNADPRPSQKFYEVFVGSQATAAVSGDVWKGDVIEPGQENKNLTPIGWY